MYFKSLSINNLFSYRSPCEFDFSLPVDSSQNIVLIMGRNGQGKTNFLRSIKLLFLGVAPAEMRRTVSTSTNKSVLSPNQFVCGFTNEWYGILNLLERESGGKKCGISAVLETKDGDVKVTREWLIDFTRSSFEENLTVDTPFEGILKGAEGSEYLERCLPKDYVPFFFFDGEEVQALAESNDNTVIAVTERLLNISPLVNIYKALSDLRSDWKREAMDAEKRHKLTEVENKYRSNESELAMLLQKLTVNEAESSEIQERIDRVSRQQRILLGTPDQQNESSLKAQIDEKEATHHKIMLELVDAFQRDAFLRVTPDLTKKALETSETIIQKEKGSQAELLNSLKTDLPDIFHRPPYPSPRLEKNQAEFYQQRILKVLDSYQITDHIETIFSLNVWQARQLSRLLANYQKDHQPWQYLLKNLAEARELSTGINKLEFQLKNTGDMAREKRAEFDRLSIEEKSLKEHLLDLYDEQRKCKSQIEKIEKGLKQNANEIKELEEDVRKAGEMQAKFDFAERLGKALNEVKDVLKLQKREELEQSYNLRFLQLLDSNTLIQKVEIDDDFKRTYRDSQGNLVAMSSISAGMKHLSATALLWAMKEVSAIDMPVVIDTPMSRIDRQHQNNLLQHYYPRLGKQVIILPTDSELDEQKYSQLKPFVYCEYQLANMTGKETHVTKGTLNG
jgi:DNA sulfur modification protein DndD